VGAKHDADCFHHTGLLSEKVFVLLDKTKFKVTHNLWPEASKINILPNLHSTWISVPKMADADYITVFDKNESRIYNATTIFDLPYTQQSLLYHHELPEFPPKEMFLAAVRAGNYATWHSLTKPSSSSISLIWTICKRVT
jgi:hypothetical protein